MLRQTCDGSLVTGDGSTTVRGGIAYVVKRENHGPNKAQCLSWKKTRMTQGGKHCDNNRAVLIDGAKRKYLWNSVCNHLWNYTSSNSTDHNGKVICYSLHLSTCSLYTKNLFNMDILPQSRWRNTDCYAATGIIHSKAQRLLQSGGVTGVMQQRSYTQVLI